MALAVNLKSEVFDLWQELCDNFFPLRYLVVNTSWERLFGDVPVSYLLNSLFWIFLAISLGFHFFTSYFQLVLKRSQIRYSKRNQAIRAVWNIAFFGASVVFLYLYHKYMISPELNDNAGRLFPKYENTIFYKSQHCERFQIYSLFIITFYLHSALQDIKDGDFIDCTSKVLFSLAQLALLSYRFENYFVLLNINLGLFHLLTECLVLISLQPLLKSAWIFNLLLWLRILSWSNIYVNILPFKYLVPTLFAKNFKLWLNLYIWFWYGISIWNSPVLQYLYHQIYHNSPIDCVGEGLAARCILLKDGQDHKHFKTLRKAYLEVKLANEKQSANMTPSNENASAKAFQAIKCVMTLKRKLRRIRSDKESPSSESSDTTFTTSSSAAGTSTSTSNDIA